MDGPTALISSPSTRRGAPTVARPLPDYVADARDSLGFPDSAEPGGASEHFVAATVRRGRAPGLEVIADRAEALVEGWHR